jgi:hypothetical protein
MTPAQGSAILKLSVEKGQVMLVGSVVRKAVILLSLSRNEGTSWVPIIKEDYSVLNRTALGPSASVVGPY